MGCHDVTKPFDNTLRRELSRMKGIKASSESLSHMAKKLQQIVPNFKV